MRKIRGLLSVVLILILVSGTVPCYAYKHPSAFWPINSKYTAALDSCDYNGIITYGKQILDLMKKEPDCYDTRQIRGSRMKEIANAYAEKGDYATSFEYYKQLNALATRYKSEMPEWYMGSELAMDQYTPVIQMYTDRGASSNYGAKNEKPNGVLFGLCADGAARSSTGHESMVLTYQELGQKLIPYNTGVMRSASSEGLAVEFALNCPKQGDDIRNIRNLRSYLEEVSDLLSSYPKVPVYLRFAAEFDVWKNAASPEDFVYAFRYVSDYFKQRNSNVAMVWCPTQAASDGINIDDYYPGDSYVDWVGISSYAVKYHIGDVNQSEWNSLVFKSGKNSSPVIAIKDIVETYGDRKPIMLSESGSGHEVCTIGEDTTDFALYRLREYYTYIPMVYPQVKLMAHFDQYIKGSTNDFRLSSNNTLKKEYVKLTKGSRFIQDRYSGETGVCYRKLTDGMSVRNVFPVSTYAHIYNDTISKVTYFVDGKYAAVSTEMPFTAYIDTQGLSGAHTVKAVAVGNSGATITTESRINIESNSNRDITVEVSGDEVSFDQEPVLYNNRTMVPMRKIFEELGAKVTWDEATKTATGKKGDRAVKVTLDSKTMYVNSKKIELDTPPIMISDRTLVPVRAVAEGLGCDVEWNDRKALVSIEPKVFKWSKWDDDLPSYVDEDLYYIEEKEEYKYREKEYFEKDTYSGRASNFVREEVEYGSWSSWQTGYISENDSRQVQTRTQSTPERYFYAHYCTGNISDSDNRYCTSAKRWHDECSYHELGWYDTKLPLAPDDDSSYIKYVDGEKYRCSNTCFRWYIMDKQGGEYTEYRYRPVYRTYIYWQWSDWSDYDDWYPRGRDVDVRERTVYRYKEK